MSVPGKQARKQAHAIFKSIKCFSAAQVEKLSHSKGSVSPQLQSGRSLCVSSCNYLPTRSIWFPVGRIGIYRPESTRNLYSQSLGISNGSSLRLTPLCYPSAQTAYLEGVLMLSKQNAAEDGFVEGFRIQQFLKFRFSKGTNAELKLRSTLQQSAGLVVF